MFMLIIPVLNNEIGLNRITVSFIKPVTSLLFVEHIVMDCSY